MTKEEKKAKIKALQTAIKALTPAQRQAIADKYGIVTIEGHPLSPVNNCLLVYQSDNVTVVGGYRQWQRAGRQVRKGEHSLIIWFPRYKKSEDNPEPELSGYMLGNVFDISQTEPITQDQAAG